MADRRWQCEHYDSVTSTNEVVAARALEGADEGLVVTADYQSAGRGRRERRWDVAPGAGLLCSVLLRPPLSVEQLPWVTAVVALSARAALRRLSGRAPDLKWPNDLLYDNRKVAGILAELEVTAAGPAVVVGIGINLTPAAALHEGAVSVAEATGVALTPVAVRDALLEEITERRSQLDTPYGWSMVRQEYVGALATIGQRVKILTGFEEVRGRCVGIDETGRLEVDVEGTVRAFAVGDVVHARKEESS